MTKFQEVQTYRGGTEVVVFDTQARTVQARLATDLMKQLAIAVGAPDGEDAAGRQKFRLLAPAEVAARACDIAHEAFGQFIARGWMIDIPEPKQPEPKNKEQL